MGFDLIFFGVGSYLGLYVGQQYNWILPSLKGPEELFRAISEKLVTLVLGAEDSLSCVLAGRTSSPVYQTFTGDITPDTTNHYEHVLKELLTEHTSNDWT